MIKLFSFTNNNIKKQMRIKQRAINQKSIQQHTRKLFTLTQPFPSSILSLLLQKRKRQLTQKQQKQIYECIRQKNIFPVLTNPKMLIDFCAQICVQMYKAGRVIEECDDLYVIIDGAVKIFQESVKNRGGDGEEGLRLTMGAQVVADIENHKIQRQKLVIGDVLNFDKNNPHLIYIASSTTTFLKIPFHIHSNISMSSFMVEIKRKQQFFSKISLFQRHYRSSLEDFISSLEQKTCGFGKKIFSEGQLVTNIYIIKQGEFILEKNICTDDFMVKKGKIVQKIHNQSSQSFLETQIKHVTKHYRSTPYKIIGPKQILGDCQYILNNKQYFYSMKCHKEGSKLYYVNAQTFFKKLYVPQNGIERVNSILQFNFSQRKKQIQAGVKFNKSNTLILKFMPNSTLRYKTQPQSSSPQKKTSSTITQTNQRTYNSTQRSHSFFQQMNKTIINQNKGQIRKRNESRNLQIANQQKLKKIYKTPAVVQEVVHIVNQKRLYHKLRNMGKGNKCAFQFDINNVPPFIKKKYGQLLTRKKSQ